MPPPALPPALPPLAPSADAPSRPAASPRPSCGDAIPILIPLTPGRPGVWVPTPYTRPSPPALKPANDPNAETRVLGQLSPAPAAPPERPRAELTITLRAEPSTPVAPASMTDTRILRHSGLPSTPAPGTSRPTQDTPTRLIPKLSVDERRKRLLEAMLEVEAKLEMLDDPVPF